MTQLYAFKGRFGFEATQSDARREWGTTLPSRKVSKLVMDAVNRVAEDNPKDAKRVFLLSEGFEPSDWCDPRTCRGYITRNIEVGSGLAVLSAPTGFFDEGIFIHIEWGDLILGKHYFETRLAAEYAFYVLSKLGPSDGRIAAAIIQGLTI